MKKSYDPLVAAIDIFILSRWYVLLHWISLQSYSAPDMIEQYDYSNKNTSREVLDAVG